MEKAIWNNVALAENGKMVSIEGNAYFLAESIN